MPASKTLDVTPVLILLEKVVWRKRQLAEGSKNRTERRRLMCFAFVSSSAVFQHCPVMFISTPCSLSQGHILSPPSAYVGQIAVLTASSLTAQYIFL